MLDKCGLRKNVPSVPFCLGLIAMLGAAVRFWPNPMPYMELDAAIYTRTATELAAAWQSGALWQQPFTGEHYSSIDYWPPLFPLLSALLDNPRLLAQLMGWLAIWPVYYLTRELCRQGDWRMGMRTDFAGAAWAERSALLAALIMAVHPYLAWYSRVARSESLYILSFALSAALLWVGKEGKLRSLGGGVCLALAYCTRFDGLFLLAAMALSVGWLRGKRAVLWMALGFTLAALPYLAYLTWLNGGVPTAITPHKLTYDSLEGVWTRAYQLPMRDFAASFGPPGIFSLEGREEEARSLLQTHAPSMVAEGVRQLPANLLALSLNLLPLSLPLLLSLMFWRDKRTQALWISCLPILGMAVFASWDPNPRYGAFILVPLSVLAAQGLAWGASVSLRSQRRRSLAVSLALLWLELSVIVPGAVHFDQRGPVDPLWWELLPDYALWRWLIIIGGTAAFALAGYFLPIRWAGLLGTLQALGLAGGAVWAAWEAEHGVMQAVLPLTLTALIALSLLVGLTFPCAAAGDNRGVALWRWAVLSWLLIACADSCILELWGLAHSRLVYCPEIAQQLRQYSQMMPKQERKGSGGFGNGGVLVMSMQQVDAIRSGSRWLPWPTREPLAAVLERERPDYVVAAIPDPLRFDNRAVVEIPELQRTGLVELVGSYPAAGGAGLLREWRLYRGKYAH